MTRPRTPPPETDVTIERIGAEGDGIAHLPDGTPLYVPLTLPGERVRARPLRSRGDGWQAVAEDVIAAGPVRVAAPCPHFSRCGGCTLQHWRDDAYRDWKKGLLARALQQAGFCVAPMFVAGTPGQRRRMDFAARRQGSRVVMGLHAPRSAAVEDLSDCMVLHADLRALLSPLRALLVRLAAFRREASVIANRLDSGCDLLLRTDAALTPEDGTTLAAFAKEHRLARVSWAQDQRPPETIAMLRPPEIVLSGVPVRSPPGAFLQATETGEKAIIDAVLHGLPRRLTGRSRIAELYAGCGSLTFALAKAARVQAWEGDPGAVAALKQAANRNGLAGRIEVAQRDLARQPLLPKDLSGFAAVVLDPPHAGAAAQIGAIAASGVSAIVYVSCNPATLGRDARVLRSAGYNLAGATAIDQFLWSARLESVSVFQR